MAKKGRDGVKHHVLQIDGKIKQQHRGERGHPNRDVEIIEQAQAAIFGHHGQSNGKDGKG